tara:strand:+ start:13707 stop:14204 length:498 start_codon:yes stop_codon:yes gene_type:complete
MAISRKEQKKSEEFIHALNEILELIENVLPHIDEGEYLKACNNLKLIHDIGEGKTMIEYITNIVTVFRENDVVINHARRSTMPIRREQIMLSDVEKLNKGWKCCPKCDRIVHCMYQHSKSDVCRRTKDSKNLAASSSRTKTEDMTLLIHKIRAWAVKTHRYKFYK